MKETVFNLISSLADVLEHFPLLAGTIKPDESGSLHVYSENVGADFIYELKNEPFPGAHVPGLDPRGLEIGLPVPGDPLIAIKFTAVSKPVLIASLRNPTDHAPQFTCGTYVLCIATHHVVGDLTSTMDFAYAYARRFANKPYLSTVPKRWSREPLSYFDTPSAPVSSLPLMTTIPGITILPPDQPPAFPLPEPTDLVQIYTTTQKLTQIKNAINSSASNPGVSTFQVLSALLWQAVVRVALSHLPEDEPINLGLAVNGRQRAPTRAMVEDRFYGNFNPAVCVSLPRGQVVNSDVAFIASAVKKTLKEQLDSVFIARKVKTMESMDCRRFMPNTQCQFTSWPKDLMLDEDLNFGFTFVEDADDNSQKGRRKVLISAGDDVPFPIGTMQSMMLNEDTYKILVAVPRGMKEVMLEEVQAWTIEKPKVIFAPPPPNFLTLSSESQPRL